MRHPRGLGGIGGGEGAKSEPLPSSKEGSRSMGVHGDPHRESDVAPFKLTRCATCSNFRGLVLARRNQIGTTPGFR
jgi:hypothetical protein